MDCAYCSKGMKFQEFRVSGAFQAFPVPAKPSCGSASCLAQAMKESGQAG